MDVRVTRRSEVGGSRLKAHLDEFNVLDWANAQGIRYNVSIAPSEPARPPAA